MQKMRTSKEEKGNIDELRKLVDSYSAEECKVNVSDQQEVNAFLEQLMKLIGNIPPLLKINSTKIDASIIVGNKKAGGPDDPSSSIVNIYNVVNIIINDGKQK